MRSSINRVLSQVLMLIKGHDLFDRLKHPLLLTPNGRQDLTGTQLWRQGFRAKATPTA
jgi:hypothetical protein